MTEQPTSERAPTGPTPSGRALAVVGYAIAAALNLALVYAIHVWPGWRAVTFVTDDASGLIPLITLSLVASAAANVVYAASRAPWVKPTGDLVTTGISLFATVRVLQVFPFSFAGWSFDATPLVRFALIMAILAMAIAMVVNLVTLVRVIIDDTPHAPRRGSTGRVA